MERIILDSGSGYYEELLEKAISHIPELCPNWKNFCQSDPGITLIQLMAALTDVQNYTIDAISEQHKEEYIRLLCGSKRSVKCARAIIDFGPEIESRRMIKGERIKIGRKVFEYSGQKNLFIQKETLIQSIDFKYGAETNQFEFHFWNALDKDNTIKVFKQQDDNDKRWRPIEFTLKKTGETLSIKIDKPEKGKYRAVFYDCKRISGYYDKNGAPHPKGRVDECGCYEKGSITRSENEILEFGKIDGVTMQKIKIAAPEFNGIMPQTLRLWANYGEYYEEIGFNPVKNDSITLGNGRDFPILKAGGTIEAFSLILTKRATSLSHTQPVFYKGRKIENARITIPLNGEGKNAETADNTLSKLRINEMLTPKTCVTIADYEKKIEWLCDKDEIERFKVTSDKKSNKITIRVSLNNNVKTPFSEWKNKLLKKLEQYKLLTVSLEIREFETVLIK